MRRERGGLTPDNKKIVTKQKHITHTYIYIYIYIYITSTPNDSNTQDMGDAVIKDGCIKSVRDNIMYI